jgi:hypothetical protein
MSPLRWAWVLTLGAVAFAAENELEKSTLVQLLQIRRVYVDRLTGGETAAQIREMIINTLQGASLFLITENQEKADTILRGAAEDLVFTDTFSSSEGLNAHSQGGEGRGSSSATRRNNYLGSGVGENESMHIAERKHEAMASVRLTNKDGDVIWATTQESLGGKFRGASADVAEKISKQLAEDFERAKKVKGP